MRVCHVIPCISRAQGGPVNSMATLTAALKSKHCQITVGTVAKANDGEKAEFGDIEIVESNYSFGGKFRWCPFLYRKLILRDFDIIHSHGLWVYTSFLAGRFSLKKSIPHVLAPCGMLGEKALMRSGWKKVVLRRMFQDSVLENAACLHAKSEAEYNDIRRLGLKNSVAVIPNPIEMITTCDSHKINEFRQKYIGTGRKKIILYLGRLHPVKGLERLLTAWASLERFHTTWQLILAGPDESNYLAVLKNKLFSLGCGKSVSFTGQVGDYEKCIVYKAADLFVMPSDFESFGSAIGEAMMSGLPVITTTGTPWEVLNRNQAGWWVHPSPDSLASALKEGMILSNAQRQVMGEKGRALTNRFRPERVAEDMIAVYRWLAGSLPPPKCVRII